MNNKLLSVILRIVAILMIFIVTSGCTDMIDDIEKEKFEVSFEANGGTGSMESIHITEDTELVVPVNTFTREGYSFTGWNTQSDGNGIGLNNLDEFQVTNTSITLYAQWEAKTYTVTFNASGGTPDNETKIVTFDTAYGEFPTVTLVGYNFFGWNTQESGEGDEIHALTIVNITENHTLYAQWNVVEQTAYAVEHYKQDVAGVGYTLADTDNLTGTTDTTATASAKTYTGFSENTDHEEREASGNIAGDGSLVLRLYYDRDTFDVNFNSNGGSDVASIENVRYEASISAPAQPSLAGYTFSGWYKDTEFSVAWNFGTDKVMQNTTLHAKWSAIEGTLYVVEHYKQDVTGDEYILFETDSLGGTTDTTATASPKTYTGFSENTDHEEREASGNIAGDGSLVLRLYYDRNSQTISFNTAGGTSVDSITQKFDTTITPPAEPTKTGYTFTGWSPAVPGTIPAENRTLTAQWSINEYTISFNSAGGSAVASITQDFGTDVTAPTAPTRTGYTFTGWNPAVPETMPAENRTLTAQWSINEYTISFNSAGGSAVASITQDFGTDVTAPTAPTKTGVEAPVKIP